MPTSIPFTLPATAIGASGSVTPSASTPLVDQVLVHPESTASSPASATTPASSSTASSAAGSLVAKGGVAAIMVIMVAGFLAIDIVEKSRNGRKVFMRCHSFLEIQSFIPQFFI